eukprot:6191062-Pleurochrysis_carterae.AAC.4
MHARQCTHAAHAKAQGRRSDGLHKQAHAQMATARVNCHAEWRSRFPPPPKSGIHACQSLRCTFAVVSRAAPRSAMGRCPPPDATRSAEALSAALISVAGPPKGVRGTAATSAPTWVHVTKRPEELGMYARGQGYGYGYGYGYGCGRVRVRVRVRGHERGVVSVARTASACALRASRATSVSLAVAVPDCATLACSARSLNEHAAHSRPRSQSTAQHPSTHTHCLSLRSQPRSRLPIGAPSCMAQAAVAIPDSALC